VTIAALASRQSSEIELFARGPGLFHFVEEALHRHHLNRRKFPPYHQRKRRT
jgi:hypothetical protein